MITIYALKCAVNEKVYIGCTSGKIAKRMREHRCLLKSGKHAEVDLLADWNLYGEAAFSMLPVQILPAESSTPEKRAAELGWMELFADNGLLYNRNRTSFQPTPEAIAKGIPMAAKVNAKRTQTPEERMKRRLAQLGIPKNHGHKISATKRLKNSMR